MNLHFAEFPEHHYGVRTLARKSLLCRLDKAASGIGADPECRLVQWTPAGSRIPT
jgi:hypothetical protein